MKKLKLSLFFMLLAQLFSASAVADETTLQNMNQITASEARLLPPFCLGLSNGNFREDAQSLAQKVLLPGRDTNHFCHGMKEMIRGDRGDKKAYEKAIQDFDYVQERTATINDNELLDSASLYKAEALGKLGKTGPALTEYNKAIQINNKYHQAYTRLADYYLTLGMKQDAIETIKIGLRYSPESKGLKNRLHKISVDK
jgi:tetratricopeptide (TPR) repeat protein